MNNYTSESLITIVTSAMKKTYRVQESDPVVGAGQGGTASNGDILTQS